MQNEGIEEQAFEREADKVLSALEQALGELDGLEVDLQGGILSLEFADGIKYIVNSHRAARQIWAAAEMSAWHFDYQAGPGRWIAGKNGDELWATIAAVVSRKLGRPVKLG